MLFFFFSSRRRHTRCGRDWSSDVCSSDLATQGDDTVDARFTVLVEQLAQVFLAVADAGQVWRGGHLHLLVELQHGVRSEERRVGIECRCWGWWGDGEESVVSGWLGGGVFG